MGYQAQGTAGRDILKYSKRPGGYVVLDGERFDIKARVHALSGYSAHADQKGLIEWVESMPERPGRIKLVHGEAGAQKAMRRALDESLRDWDGWMNRMRELTGIEDRKERL